MLAYALIAIVSLAIFYIYVRIKVNFLPEIQLENEKTTFLENKFNYLIDFYFTDEDKIPEDIKSAIYDVPKDAKLVNVQVFAPQNKKMIWTVDIEVEKKRRFNSNYKANFTILSISDDELAELIEKQ